MSHSTERLALDPRLKGEDDVERAEGSPGPSPEAQGVRRCNRFTGSIAAATQNRASPRNLREIRNRAGCLAV